MTDRCNRLPLALRAGCFAFAFVVPSLGAVQHYRPAGTRGAVVYAVLASVFFIAFYVWGHRLLPRLGRKTATWLGVATVVLLTALFVAAIPRTAGMFSHNRMDTVNLGVDELLHGRYPYYKSIRRSEPMSNLPGSLLLATPFVLLGSCSHQNYVWLLVYFFLLVGFFQNPRMALLLFWGMLLGSAVVARELIKGSDMLSNCMYILAAVFGVVYYGKLSKWQRIALAVFSGVALSSRPNFLMLAPLVFSYLVQNVGWREAVKYSLITGGVFAGITLPFYFYDPAGFSPLHISRFFDRFDAIIPHAKMVISTICLALAVGLSTMKLKNNPLRLLWACALVQMVPSLSGIALNSIREREFEVYSFANFGLSFMLFLAIALWGYRMAETQEELPAYLLS